MTVAYAPDSLSLRPESTFVVELTAFSGPLDLLLSLIREEQVDIYDIPIARICEQFVVRIRTLGLNEAAEYLEMAARLLRIKAQMLLPRSDEEQWEDPRAELVRRLLEYQQMREVVDLLERRGEERRARGAGTVALRASLGGRSRAAIGEATEHSRSRAADDRHPRRDHDHSLRSCIASAHSVDGNRREDRRAVAGSLDASWLARAREGRRAPSGAAQTICQRGNLS